MTNVQHTEAEKVEAEYRDKLAAELARIQDTLNAVFAKLADEDEH